MLSQVTSLCGRLTFWRRSSRNLHFSLSFGYLERMPSPGCSRRVLCVAPKECRRCGKGLSSPGLIQFSKSQRSF